MPPTSRRSNDPRIPETLKHLKILARRHDRRLVVQDYLEYRARYAPHLPALTTVYRLLGSWPEALAAAGVEQSDKSELSRTSDEALIAALRQAADELGVKVLSSHAYDEYRKQHNAKAGPDDQLPSSSVIRKWLGRWGEAVKLAGLETTERSAPHKPTLSEIIEALREAKKHVDGMLTHAEYAEFYAALPEEQRKSWPDVTQILQQFPSWDTALRAADVEQSDAFHPQALWTAEEARRITQQVERVLGRKPNRQEYEQLMKKSTKMMPSWSVMQELLSS